MVKVIWHKAASPLQVDGSIVFARCANIIIIIYLYSRNNKHNNKNKKVKNKHDYQLRTTYNLNNSLYLDLGQYTLTITVSKHQHIIQYSTLAPPGKYGWTCGSFDPPESTTQTAVLGRLMAESHFLWSPYVIGQTIIFLPCDFYLSIYLLLLSSFFSSPNLSGRRLDVYHTSTHGVASVQI